MTDTRFAILPCPVLYDRHLSSNAVRVFCVLDDYDGGGGAWPRHSTIAARLQWSPDTVRRAIRELVRHGWVVKYARFSVDGRQKSNEYRLFPWRTSAPLPCADLHTHEQEPVGTREKP